MHRLIHLSDLHLPARNDAQLEALHRAISVVQPTLIVLTGDLTRNGSRSEFGHVRRFIARLASPALVVPGNHDVPVRNILARMMRPFHRFTRHSPQGVAPVFRDDALIVAGLNTARGASMSLDWSRGTVSSHDIHHLRHVFASSQPHALRILACHHPVAPVRTDMRRSRTHGSAHALSALSLMRVQIILHGHLHHAHATLVDGKSGALLQIGATTALSDRERGDGAGFNLLEYDAPQLKLTKWLWSGLDYQASASGEAASLWNIGADIALIKRDETSLFQSVPGK